MSIASTHVVPDVRLGDVLDLDNLRRRIADGYIEFNRHRAGAALAILDYSRLAQFRNEWDNETMTCRGLIISIDEQGDLGPDSRIVARAFPKFFNLDQHQALAARGDVPPLPEAEHFDVFAKEDGSLGIAYLDPSGRPAISTRGSFHSVQADWATAYLRSRPELEAAAADLLTRGTPCFEIISPVSRIVKIYDFDDLILLALIDRTTGLDLPHQDLWPGRVVPQFDGFNDYRTLAELDWPNEEGFVVRFASGPRAKLKFPEYVRRHRIVTGVSTTTLWEHLAVGHVRDLGILADHAVSRLQIDHRQVAKIYAIDGDPLAALLEDVPDEFDRWVRDNVNALKGQYAAREQHYLDLFAQLPAGLSRKDLAAHVNGTFPRKSKDRGAMFELLDGRTIAHIVWTDIRPDHHAAWATDPDS